MKVLIIGEYSGFSKNLCRGFNNIGHEACVFNWGDSFKKIVSEEGSISINIYNYRLCGFGIKGSHHIRRFFSNLKIKKIIKKNKGKYDCVLIINPTFIKRNKLWYDPYPSIDDVKSMLKNQDMIFLSACGNDFIFNSYLPYREKTSEYYRNKYLSNLANSKDEFLNVLNSIRGIIPVMVDYADAYRKFQPTYKYRLFDTIPMAFDCNSIKINEIKNKAIRVFHGVTRGREKGSDIIIEALDKISDVFGDKVEIIVVSKVPLKEYLRLMKDSDIVIDQCYAYSYGMNAIEAMAMGKVVLSGNEPNNIKEFGIDFCPVVNIKPSVDNIVEELVNLISKPEKIKDISQQSIEYVEKIHECAMIAKKYIKLFKEEFRLKDN